MAELREMKYDLKGRDLVCPECFAKERKGGIKDEEKMAAGVTGTVADGNKKDESRKITGGSRINDDEARKTSYQCGSCGFGFSKDRQERVGSCPYCGKNTVRIAFRDSMQKLMEEAESEKFGD
ncbi:hypothetical protein J4470_02465 [Candidatus Woesearchaeota archaeon]|nr:hypothetical protein [Candidatus Woesearchaeota archaeon]